MTLNLKPESEVRLIALAQASGVFVEDFLLNVVEEKVVEEKTGRTPALRLNPEQWVEQFEAWADSFPDAPLLPDEALSRENLYPDRW